MAIQKSYDFEKEEIIWFDVGYVFGKKKNKDPKHGYPVTSRGPLFAFLLFAGIVILAIVAAMIF